MTKLDSPASHRPEAGDFASKVDSESDSEVEFEGGSVGGPAVANRSGGSARALFRPKPDSTRPGSAKLNPGLSSKPRSHEHLDLRPEFRNIGIAQILNYRMAPAAIVSILHRVSGVLMFLVGIPFTLYLFQKSISSELSFETYRAAVASWPGKLVLLALFWSFFHHLLAGIRFLALDLHFGTEREPATRSARIVLAASALLTLVSAFMLFGLF